MRITALVVLSSFLAVPALAGPPAPAVAPPPQLVEAHQVVGRWLEAQNAKPGPRVELFGEQYGVEKDGVNALSWSIQRSQDGAGELSIRIFQLKPKSPGAGLAIVSEKSSVIAAKLSGGVDITGGGSTSGLPAFPKDFAKTISADGGRCGGDELCAAKLEIDGKTVPLGFFSNNPDGEYTGDYQSKLLTYKLMKVDPVGLALLIVVDNHQVDKPQALVRRRATLISSTDFHVLWTGDLVGWAKGKKKTYKVGGEKVTQIVDGDDDQVSCRVAILHASKQNAFLLHTCGGVTTTAAWDGKRFK